jgi:hypothetical protein
MAEEQKPQHSRLFILIIFIGVPLVILYIGMTGTASTVGATNSKMCSGEYDRIVSDIPIISLNDRYAIEGSFFLGSGYISEEPVYVFYTNDNTHGGYRLDHAPVETSSIFMDSDSMHRGARLITTNKYTLHKSFPLDLCLPDEWNEIHVPEGTIINEYKLDGV